MVTISKDVKLLTLSLILRTIPKTQQSLLMQHFNPDVVRVLNEIEHDTGEDVANLDWTPFYQSWPELKKILDECRREIKAQGLARLAEEQRPKLREYILIKLGKQRKGAPIFLSPDILKIVDQFLATTG